MSNTFTNDTVDKRQSRKDFEIFLYKNKLNEKTLIDLLPNLSSKSICYLMKDLNYLFEKVSNEKLYIFTDGGCIRNGKPDCKAGYSVFFTEDQDSMYYNFNTTKLIVKEPTNNKAELSAIKYVFLTICENITLFENKNILICTDSMYSINCIQKWASSWIKNNWKNSKGEPVKNKSIIETILESKKYIQDQNKNINVDFKHIFSHTQEPKDKSNLEYYLWYGNNVVDENIKKILNL
jgi:ribonuclease HI